MLLTPAKSLAVALCPNRIGLVWRSRRSELARELQDCAPGAGPAWQAPLQAMATWLDGRAMGRTRVSVVLSSRFVRYALIPWAPARLSREEQLAWTRLHFEAASGDMNGWRVSCDPGRYGQPSVACAVPEGLLTELQDLLAMRRLSMGAVVPYFVCSWNRWCRQLTAGALFGVAESDRIVFGHQGPGGWQSLRLLTARTDVEQLEAFVQREAALLGTSDTLSMRLHAPGLAPAGRHGAPSQGIGWLMTNTTGEPPELAMTRLVAT